MRYTLNEIENMPTLHQGQYDNLVVDEPTRRVWLSRLDVADGQPYDNEVTVEVLEDGCWITAETYEPGESITPVHTLAMRLHGSWDALTARRI